MSDFEVIDKPQNIAKGQCDIKPYIDDRENTVDSPFTIEEKKKLDKIFKQSQEAKYQVIENPFMIHSKFGIRVGLGKNPNDNKGNTDFIDLYETGTGECRIVNHLDPAMNYTINKNLTVEPPKEYSLINKYDYELSAEHLNNHRTDLKEPHKYPLPLSFIQINNERDGALWYKTNYPRIPDDLIPIIARYHWGEPMTKKSIKNEKKKIEKKANQKGLKIEHKKVSVEFD